MSIRTKLLSLFSLTLAVLSGIGLYAVSIYQSTLENERNLTETTNLAVEYSHQTESAYRSQLSSWKNVLLRGDEAENYHRYLQKFYSDERRARDFIRRLQQQVFGIADAQQLVENLDSAHREMGRKFRDAIRVFNDTPINRGQVTDLYVVGIEDIPTALLGEITELLGQNRNQQLEQLASERVNQEKILFVMICSVVIISYAIFLWLMDKSIVQPAEHAAHLAEIIDNAQRVAKFGTWDWEFRGDRHYWSDGLYEILALDKGEKPSRQQFLCALHEDDRDRVRMELEHALRKHTAFELEARIRMADGQERVMQQRGKVTRNNKEGQLRMTSIVYDITERKESENRLAYLANYDPVTNLPNRNLFQDRLKHAMSQAERKNGQVALLYLDLDHFKAVNDALGHQAGDTLLVEAAQRIRESIREGDTVARLGGDEFTIVIEQPQNNSQIAVVAEHVLDALNNSYTIDNNEVFVSASMGITIFPRDGHDVETMLRNADSAMYLAKERGRNAYHFYTEELNRRAQERLHLENSLRMALERDQYQLHFQPQVELTSGRIIGAEALLRWVPDQSPVSPARFVPVLEETGLIIPVGKWVLEQACSAAKDIQERGLSDFRIAVNLAARQLRQADIAEYVKQALQSSGLSAELLEIELTESTLVDARISEQNLKSLERLGIRIAIDDFGTGYSSLSYLKQYSVDVLKIDKTFIKDISKDKDDDAVTSAIVALSHKLDMRVVAEGVETLEQLEFLRKQQCDLAQGFLIGRPMLKHQFLDWLSKHQSDGEPIAHWRDPKDETTIA